MGDKSSFAVVGDIVVAAIQQGSLRADSPKTVGRYFNELYSVIVEGETEDE